MLFALGAARGLIGGGGPLKMLQRSLPLGLGRLLTVPSQKRAGGPANQLVASANAGNVTAAATILARTGFGIEKERAVWRAALQRVSADMVLAAQRYGRQVLSLVDQSGPEAAARSALANARDVSTFATRTSARAKGRKAERTEDRTTTRGGTRAPKRKAAGVRQSRVAGQVHEAEAYEGRRSIRRERGSGERWAKRYDPITGAAWRVPESDSRYDAWDSRRARAGTRAYGRATGSRGLAGAAARGASRLPAAAAALGAGTAAALAAVGGAAYYITSRVLDDIAEGNTGANLVGLVTALAHSQLTRKLKRQPTRAEYRDMVEQVREQLTVAVKEAMAPSLKTQLRNFLNLWR